MNAGQLRHRVSFLKKSLTVNSVGESTGWTPVYSCWASIEILKAKMYYQTAAFIAESTYQIVIRYPRSVSLNVSDHMVFNGTTFEVDAVTNVEMRSIELNILAHVINEAS